LFSEENINNVLDSYGVKSYLAETQRDGRKSSNADGTIRFNLYRITDEPAKTSIRVCVDDGKQRWEKVEVTSTMYVSEVVATVRTRFNLGPDLLRVLTIHNKQYIGEDGLVMPMIQESEKLGKPFELMLQKDISPSSNSSIAKPPSHENKRNFKIQKRLVFISQSLLLLPHITNHSWLSLRKSHGLEKIQTSSQMH
jgi:hypothetical protein